MKQWQVLILSALVFALLVGASTYVLMRGDAGDGRMRREKCLGKTIGEEIKLNQHGLYGIDVLSCRKVRIVKRKFGFVSIGGLNDLVVDDLRVTMQEQSVRGMPQDASRAIADTVVNSANGSLDPQDLLRKLGLPTFSCVRIDGLQIFSLDMQTNAVPRIVSRSAVSNLNGLTLYDCDIFNEKSLEHAEQAELRFVGNIVNVTWPSGQITF